MKDFLGNELQVGDKVVCLEKDYTGIPPARTKSSQLIVKDSDMKLLDKLFSIKTEYGSYYKEEDRVKGRYVRVA